MDNRVRQNRSAVLDARSAPRRGERPYPVANQSRPLRRFLAGPFQGSKPRIDHRVRQNRGAVLDARSAPRRGERPYPVANQSRPLRRFLAGPFQGSKPRIDHRVRQNRGAVLDARSAPRRAATRVRQSAVIKSFFTGLFSTIRVSNSLNSSLQSLRGDAAEEPVLSIRGAVKTLGSWRALDGVDLDLYAGEILVLLGPNGAGKSTLLGGACGRLPLDAGEVSLFGRSPRRDASVRSKLGFVPQHLAVYPYLSVRENLEIIGRMMGVRRRDLEQRVKEAMSWAGLTERAGDTTETLSGGMRRRLNIVASLMHHPAVVLLDEPTVGVDMGARERVHEMLRRLRTSGLGMLLTTHDLSQAEDLADRVAFMVDGKVVLVGSSR